MPRNRFEVLAERWVPGNGAVEVRPLTAGLVNESCRVLRDGAAYSLRIAAADGTALGLDRRWECAVRERAAAAGLAPPVRRCDPERGILVADWVTGRTWSAVAARLPDNIDVMARLLRRVHALDVPRPARRMDPAAWIAHYRAAAPLHDAPELAHASDAHLAKLAEHPVSPLVLCHSDLHRFNLLIGDRAVLLDWEYAHVSEGLWDVAGWVANNDWTALEAGLLLAAYLGRPASTADLQRLHSWVWLYDYVSWLWSGLYASRRPDAQQMEIGARAAVLATRLAHGAGRS